jgi:predicted phage terminase large subunit-like protein
MNISDVVENVELELLSIPEGRIELTKYNPLLFALIYLPHHLQNSKGEITLSEFHIDLAEYGKNWIHPPTSPKQNRDAWIAPRESGKSTWIFLILPLWAAAHNHVKFIAAFSDAASQAETHLITFKNELDTNEYLQIDYPELCKPKIVSTTGRALANNSWRIVQSNDFIFDANGIDTNSLGKKVFGQRPDLIILDDIEKGEKNYSEYQAGQQLNTVFDDIAPMNIYARMVFVGTTTMPNSIMDQFRKFCEFPDDSELQWIKDQNVKAHYYPAIMQNEDGSERSVWEEKWSLEWLKSQRHLRDFAKNYMNRPINVDGTFWANEDITIEDLKDYGNTIISVDPAVTKNKVSDYTGIAVLSRGIDDLGNSVIYVRDAQQVKLSPSDLSDRVRDLADTYDAGLLYVETNQGGDLWQDVFKGIPIKYRSKHQKLSKQIRAGKALNYYQQGKVRHSAHFPALEEQMWSFPKVSHDDVLDAVVTGVLYFLDNKAVKISAKQFNYNRR